MSIKISTMIGGSVPEQPIEIVERKGIGHPDTICDALAENLSISLSRFYYERFGLVLHHNVDKGLLFGGRSMPAFGGGEVLEPIEIYLVGRATMSCRGVNVPVQEMVIEGTRQWFRAHFHALDPDRHLNIRCLLRPGSQELTELYLRQAKTGVALANDTSCGVGYAPYDDLEKVVLTVGQYLNSKTVHQDFPAFGQDTKVMGVRLNNNISLTVSCAFVDSHVRDMDEYMLQKKRLTELVLRYAEEVTRLSVEVAVNTADDPDANSVYLTVTGTSGEAGDDGEVGRGNRVNGLITPYRPMNMEAAAGKNPVTHVGKIYNIIANRVAGRIVNEIEAIEEVYCFMVSQIGKPVNQPQSVEVKLRLPSEALLPEVTPQVSQIVESTLAGMSTLWKEVLEGGINVY